MHSIEQSAVPAWHKFNGYWFPESVDTPCPHCAKLVNFRPQSSSFDRDTYTITSSGKCPACRETVYLWAIEPSPASEQRASRCKFLLMYPEPKVKPREPVTGIEHAPLDVRRTYEDFLAVFNAGVWSAATTCSRRTLEGILTDLLPKEKSAGGFTEQVIQLSTSIPLAKPLLTISQMLRPDEYIGRHIELQKIPDQAAAAAMLDLIECLISLVYALPGQVRTLYDRHKA